jgi:peptidoglycan hydrolase-like protein with peptidoglycan-binding domain
MANPGQPTVDQGDSGDVVRRLQRAIRRTPDPGLVVDGIFGPATETAVKQFQQGAGLTVDGIVGPATWGALGGDGPEPPTLSEGSRGGVVDKLQTVLNEGRGSFAPSSNPVLVVDGIFGPHTATAVTGAQHEAGISADGIVGLQTWALPVHAAGEVLADLCGVPGPGGS